MENKWTWIIVGGLVYLLTRKKGKGNLSGVRRRRRRLANVPHSPYHHKTEMPGVPGHHRLSNVPLSPYHHKTENPGVPGHHRLHGTRRKKRCSCGR